MVQQFVFGVEGLDFMFSDVLAPQSMIVIAGHPGAGKTTLASTICYANTLKGYRCLYISFQESKDKLFRVMKRFGLDLGAAELRGLLLYVKFPIVLDVESVISEISRLVQSYGPRVIVVDSTNVLLNAVGEDRVKRAWLQNFFYDLARAIDGVVVLVAEIPYDGKSVELGAIEFVSDAMFILKHRIDKGVLHRFIEVRKARSAPIVVAETSFMIAEGIGIHVEPLELPLALPAEGEKLDVICGAMKRAIGYIRRGEKVYISYPPDLRVVEGWGAPPYILAFVIKNNLRTLFMSYKYSAETLRELFIEQIAQFDIDRDVAANLVDKYITFIGINPFAVPPGYIPPQVLKAPLQGVGAIVFHGIEARYMSMGYRDYAARFFSVVTKLKKDGIVDITFSARVSKRQYRTDAAFSDVVVRISIENNDNVRVLTWRRGGLPAIITLKDLEMCMAEVRSELIKGIESLTSQTRTTLT